MKFSFLVLLIFAIACSPFEVVRLLGVGTKPFYQQGKTYSRIFDKDFFSCYDQIIQDLYKLEAQFYRGGRKKGFIIATHFNKSFKQSSESTEVAIFFKEVSNLETEVTISCLNHGLAEFVASNFFGDTEEKKR